MRKSIESNKHTQIKLLLRFYQVIHDKRHLRTRHCWSYDQHFEYSEYLLVKHPTKA